MKIYRVHQKLHSNPLKDVAKEVRSQLDALDLKVPSGEIAITAGSRGIDNIALITRTVGDWLKEQGAKPFIVPAMGSHNGATAEGQRQMIESLGITEDAMQMPIRASMEVVKLGTVTTGEVYMDRHCFEADGVFVLNRIKLHTCFSGPIQSGLTKMMVVGMGKIKSAETFHSMPTAEMKDLLPEMGEMIINSGKILCGLAIIEDGFDQTTELHAVRPKEILQKEPELLKRYEDYFPALPIRELNTLIVREIGKTYSGTGMDTNVIGYRGVKYYEDLEYPRIDIIGCLSLAPESKGNAIGVGLADFITKRLKDAIDEEKTFINVLTTGEMMRGKIPPAMPDDKALIETIRSRFGDKRWMIIPNTLHLEHLYVSEDLGKEVAQHPKCELASAPMDFSYNSGQLNLDFH